MPAPLVRIIGCGSPVGDDAVGWEVIRILRDASAHSLSSHCAPPSVEACCVEGGHALLDRLDGCDMLILVDATLSGAGPGTIHRFEWPDERLTLLWPGSTHDLTPAAALELAATLGLLPPRIVVYGIEAARFELGEGLSDPVRAALPAVVRRITEEIDRCTKPTCSAD